MLRRRGNRLWRLPRKSSISAIPWGAMVRFVSTIATLRASMLRSWSTAHKYLPTLESKLTSPDGKPGWSCTFYKHDAEGNLDGSVGTFSLNDTRVKLNDFLPSGLTKTWSIKLEGKLVVGTTGPFELGLTVSGAYFPLKMTTLASWFSLFNF